MWDANPVYSRSFYSSYVDMLETELGWRITDWHPFNEEEVDVNDPPQEMDVLEEAEQDAMDLGFECEEVLDSDSDSDDEQTEIESLLLYQDIVAVVNNLPYLGSAENPIDLTYL
jgi:hypothetical protein